MQKGTEVGFKSLLTLDEYNRLNDKFKGNRVDLQTNHYFDTSRFSLKALDISLRVRERETKELTLKRKKGYSMTEITQEINDAEYREMNDTGIIIVPEIQSDLTPIIGEQKIARFLSLSTERTYLNYNNGLLLLDKNCYAFSVHGTEHSGFVDYEIEYLAKSYHQGKKEFIEIISELEIQYKKADKKIKRAYTILKGLH
jgi:uncharacterized protein YjbK